MKDNQTNTDLSLEEIGEGTLYLGSTGVSRLGLGHLESDPIAKKNQPPLTGWCDTSYLSRYDGTDFFQWHGRRSDGMFHPYGKIMRIAQS